MVVGLSRDHWDLCEKKLESTFRIKNIKVKIMKKREKRCHSIQKTMSFSQTDYVVVN